MILKHGNRITVTRGIAQTLRMHPLIDAFYISGLTPKNVGIPVEIISSGME